MSCGELVQIHFVDQYFIIVRVAARDDAVGLHRVVPPFLIPVRQRVVQGLRERHLRVARPVGHARDLGDLRDVTVSL